MIRLQKYIADSGYCSRRKAEELISCGKVKVNGIIITELGTKIDESDSVKVNNKLLKKQVKEYYLLNKPRGIICSSKDEKNRKTVVDLIKTSKRIYPVGRLDYDTTGLILLTNDGEFANLMMSPRNEIKKTYIAKLKGIITIGIIKKIQKGVIIDNTKCIPDKVKLKRYDEKNNTSMVEIVIHEGKNHEVKKIFESFNLYVLKLKREKYAFLTLNGLKSGEYRKLSNEEIKELKSLIK